MTASQNRPDADVSLGQFPHCDELVLHAPGECEYCDRHPDWQALRELWGVAFSGHDPQGWESPCPSEMRRPRETIILWAGNVAKPEGWVGQVFDSSRYSTGTVSAQAPSKACGCWRVGFLSRRCPAHRA